MNKVALVSLLIVMGIAPGCAEVDPPETEAASDELVSDTIVNFDDGAQLNRDEVAIGYSLPFEAMGNSTDAGASGGLSPIKVTVINNTVSGTYS